MSKIFYQTFLDFTIEITHARYFHGLMGMITFVVIEEDLDAAELFMEEMEGYLEEYDEYLETVLKPRSIGRHTRLIGFFIDELNARYGVTGFEHITYAMCGSKFVRYYNSNCDESMQLKSSKNILLRFFSFIYDRHGIGNDALMGKLAKP